MTRPWSPRVNKGSVVDTGKWARRGSAVGRPPRDHTKAGPETRPVSTTADRERMVSTMKGKLALCPRCEGHGKHTNPAIDGNGITASEMDELGEDFREDYFGGLYDVTCERCHGEKTVPECHTDSCHAPVEATPPYHEPDVVHCYEHLLNSEEEAISDHEGYLAEIEAERRMGA